MDTNVAEELTIELGRALLKEGYQFTTVTPETHRRILAREPDKNANSLRELFGWNRPLPVVNLPPAILQLAERAQLIERQGNQVTSKVRFSTLNQNIFMHSAFPTEQEDAVFFGPDSYRFVRFLIQKIKSAKSIVDIGCGSGVGGLALARHLKESHKKDHTKNYTVELENFFLADISVRALEFARINSKMANAKPPQFLQSDLFKNIPTGIDVVIANPPFIMDRQERFYRHGGQAHGSELSVRIVAEALNYLQPGGQLVLYTGTAVVNGRDIFRQAIAPLIKDLDFSYEEIDPDIFGEELTENNYLDVERIAAVGLVVFKK